MAQEVAAITSGAEATQSVAFRLPVGLVEQLDLRAKRAKCSRKQIIVDLIGAEVERGSAALASLSLLVRLHHRLDRSRLLDEELRHDIADAVRLTAELARRDLAA